MSKFRLTSGRELQLFHPLISSPGDLLVSGSDERQEFCLFHQKYRTVCPISMKFGKNILKGKQWHFDSPQAESYSSSIHSYHLQEISWSLAVTSDEISVTRLQTIVSSWWTDVWLSCVWRWHSRCLTSLRWIAAVEEENKGFIREFSYKIRGSEERRDFCDETSDECLVMVDRRLAVLCLEMALSMSDFITLDSNCEEESERVLHM
jgi:hypothetical protein